MMTLLTGERGGGLQSCRGANHVSDPRFSHFVATLHIFCCRSLVLQIDFSIREIKDTALGLGLG